MNGEVLAEGRAIGRPASLAGDDLARLLVIGLSTALLAGALGSQYIGGLFPCEMCHWQRWGHYAAIVFALLSFALRGQPFAGRLLLWLAVAGIASSGLIGAYHAGVELGVFEGFTQCTTAVAGSNADILAQIMAAPMVRCDEVQWSFLGISMAGWNAILSLGAAASILWVLCRRRPA